AAVTAAAASSGITAGVSAAVPTAITTIVGGWGRGVAAGVSVPGIWLIRFGIGRLCSRTGGGGRSSRIRIPARALGAGGRGAFVGGFRLLEVDWLQFGVNLRHHLVEDLRGVIPAAQSHVAALVVVYHSGHHKA